MSKFILLHSIYDNHEILIDFDRVSHCEVTDDGEKRYTELHTNQDSFAIWRRVKELPKDILKMLNNGK